MLQLKLNKIATAVLWAMGGSTLLNVQSALAQEPQRVEITGSNIKRIDVETSSPVQVITREEIRRSGASSVKELLDLLPSASASLSDIGGSNSFASGASSASLRNLGKQATLVLLNSRRVSPYALADYNEVFTNLDALPLDAVDRVEVLKNGASAIYGSDAVAGVINIITRKDYRGLQLSASHQQSLKSKKFGQTIASITGGVGDLTSDRYNVLANVELFQRDNVIWREVLEYMNPVTKARIPQTLTAQYSTFSWPGNVIGVGPIAGCPADMVISNLCRYDRYTRFEAMPSADRVNLLVSGRVLLGGTLEGFSELVYARTKTTYLSPFTTYGAASGATTWGNPSTGKGSVFYPRGLPVGHPLNPTKTDDIELRYRFIDTPSEGAPTSDNYRMVAGLRGTTGKFDWESAVSFMGAKTTDLQTGRFSDSAFKKLIGDYNLDPLPSDFFNKAGGYRIGQTNSPEVISQLFPAYGQTGKTTQSAIDGKISGEIVRLPAGMMSLAAGFDLRHETFTIDPTDNLRNGDIVGFGLSATKGSRNFGALFGELSVPLAEKLELQLATRVDKFPNLSVNLSPKVGVRFEPTSGLLLRGTMEGGFRAPNLTETAPSTKFAFSNGVYDPLRCPAAQALSEALLTQANKLPANDPNKSLLEARADIVDQSECSAGVASIAGNNPKLKPEVSSSFSLGMVFEPVKGFSLSADYWNIKRKDEIGIKGTQELLAVEGTTLPDGSKIERESLNKDTTFTAAEQAQYGVKVGPLNSITRSFENVSKTKTSGIDVGINHTAHTSLGKLDVSVLGTYLLNYYAFSTVKNAYGDNLAGRYTYPRLTASIGAALTTGAFTNGVKLRHSSRTSLQGDYFDDGWNLEGCAARKISDTECSVAPSSIVDYYIAYRGVKNLTVSAFVTNLFDRLPPADLRDLAENGSNIIPQSYGDAQRRTLKLALEYKFF
ncbi:MAG: TonB-dependent receptor [Ideonella sp.]|nr:TonB-dependent receptor [Ideonella sp.]